VTSVQILVFIVTVSVYGIAPINVKKVRSNNVVTSLCVFCIPCTIQLLSSYIRPSPFPSGRIFRGAGHEKSRGEQLKWSLAFRLTLDVFHVHSYQDQFIQHSVFLCI